MASEVKRRKCFSSDSSISFPPSCRACSGIQKIVEPTGFRHAPDVQSASRGRANDKFHLKLLRIVSMKSLNVCIAPFLFIAFSCQAFADYAINLSVDRYYVTSAGDVYFGTTPKPNNTCSNWGEYFRFNTSSVGGKNMLATLMSAKITGKKIIVWYIPVSGAYVDTNQSTGCTSGRMSTLTSVGIR